MEKTVCNLCRSDQSEMVYELSDWLLERVGSQFTLVRCKQCGLVYQNPRPLIDEMEEHYPPEYESYQAMPGGGKTSWIARLAVNYGLNKRIRAITRYKRQGSLLDVGCASGRFIGSLNGKPDWNVAGVEISPYASQLARDQGLNVFTGTLEQATFPDNSFDVVTMWDVLEHLHDPGATLREVYRILKADGILVLRLPNADSRDAKLFGPYWSGLDAPRHLYVFGITTLSNLLAKTGFQVQRIRCDFGEYFGFVLSLKYVMMARGMEKSKRERIGRILYHPLTRLFTAPFFYFYGGGLHGSQMLVVSSKAPDGSLPQQGVV